MAHDLTKLEHHLKTLDHRLAELAGINLPRELQLIIRAPGWTTLPEALLVANAVESLIHNTEDQIQQSKLLLEAARQITEAGKKASAA